MKPESKVVTLGTARRLKAAGFPQNTERWWCLRADAKWQIASGGVLAGRFLRSERVAAPDATEIGELLPATIRKDDVAYYFEIAKHDWPPEQKHKEAWGWCYNSYKDDKRNWRGSGTYENQAEAVADCWLYLKEKKLI
jgi:hypothetical protein